MTQKTKPDNRQIIEEMTVISKIVRTTIKDKVEDNSNLK
jgi:hypothetical protein